VLPHGSFTAVVGARPAAVVVAAATGLVVGSFLNVVVYRTPRKVSVVRPGSFCPTCETPIRGYDNVPLVSWLLLRGRCRTCRTPISVRYPAVELATAVLFGSLAWLAGPHWTLPGLCVLAATVLVLALIELDGLPPEPGVAQVGTVAGVALLTAAALADQRWWRLIGMSIGTFAAVGILALVARTRTRTTAMARAPWGLLPAGPLFGWLGPIGSLVGVALTVAVLLAERKMRHSSRFGIREGAPGASVAVGAAAVAAVISAWAGGSSVGL